MPALTHQEAAAGLRPRHPVVCGIDVLGLGVTLALIAACRPQAAVAPLLLAIVAQYGVSGAYHWLPYNLTRQKLDHLIIVLLIGVTITPYWLICAPARELAWRLPLLLALTLATAAVRWFCFVWSKAGGALYLLLGAFGLTVSFNELPVWLPPLAFAGFWAGIALYFAQFVVHASQWPDPAPRLYGWRELQHTILLAATTLQAAVALSCL